jgi:hypothetical protein
MGGVGSWCVLLGSGEYLELLKHNQPVAVECNKSSYQSSVLTILHL